MKFKKVKGYIFSREIDGIKINGGWSEIVNIVIEKYSDKPFLISMANNMTVPTWNKLGFKLFNEKTSNLSDTIKQKLKMKKWKYPLYYREAKS